MDTRGRKQKWREKRGRNKEISQKVHGSTNHTPQPITTHLGVVDIYRIASSWYPEDGSIIKELGELVRVEGGTGDEELHVWAKPGNVLYQTKEDVCVECTLMSLINNDDTAEGGEGEGEER